MTLLEQARRHSVPSTLLLLTGTTGLVDAVSYLGLGHVFTANMTGNVVFLGFALAGASGLSVSASSLALGAGALLGAALVLHYGLAWPLAIAFVAASTAAAVYAVVPDATKTLATADHPTRD